jgi:hypothetical protein
LKLVRGFGRALEGSRHYCIVLTVSPGTPEVSPKTVEISQRTLEISPGIPGVFLKILEISLGTPWALKKLQGLTKDSQRTSGAF